MKFTADDFEQLDRTIPFGQRMSEIVADLVNRKLESEFDHEKFMSELVMFEPKDLKNLGFFDDQAMCGLLNSILIKKALVRVGRCPHSKEDVMILPMRSPVQFECTACGKSVEPESYRVRAS
jgi:hypothetical protein